MGIEIERKFLLKESISLPDSDRVLHMVQGYLASDEMMSIRIRIIDDSEALLTIKQNNHSTLSMRSEYEYQIPVEDALEMLQASPFHPVIKQRHVVNISGTRWELDFFEDLNEGLITAEVELPSINTPVVLPAWIGREVTNDPKYLNSRLALHPYTEWDEDTNDSSSPDTIQSI